MEWSTEMRRQHGQRIKVCQAMTPKERADARKARKAEASKRRREKLTQAGLTTHGTPYTAAGRQIVAAMQAPGTTATKRQAARRRRSLRCVHKRRDPNGRAPLTLAEIATRVSNLCYCCGGAVDMAARATERDGPWTEHIIPKCHFDENLRWQATWGLLYPGQTDVPYGFGMNHPDNLAISHARCNRPTRPLAAHPNWIAEQRRRGTYLGDPHD